MMDAVHLSKCYIWHCTHCGEWAQKQLCGNSSNEMVSWLLMKSIKRLRGEMWKYKWVTACVNSFCRPIAKIGRGLSAEKAQAWKGEARWLLLVLGISWSSSGWRSVNTWSWQGSVFPLLCHSCLLQLHVKQNWATHLAEERAVCSESSQTIITELRPRVRRSVKPFAIDAGQLSSLWLCVYLANNLCILHLCFKML